MIIESTDNKTYKYLKGFLNKKQRRNEEIFLIEGIKVVKETILEKAPLYIAISTKIMDLEEIKEIENLVDDSYTKIIYIKDKIFNSLTDTENSQGIIAYYNFIHKKDISNIKKGKFVLLDDLKDPGNLGGIIRSAEAFSIDGIILTKETVDLYNPKVIRSTMASIFRVNIYIIDKKDQLLDLKDDFKIVSTAFENSISIYDFDFTDNIILTIGNEAHGVSTEIFNMSSEFIKIPMSDKINSLNANVAASICMYEMDKYGKNISK